MISHVRDCRNRAGVACVIALGLMLGACGDEAAMDALVEAPGTVPKTVLISTTPDANDSRPVEVDVVYVMKSSLAEQLSGMNAKDWFEQREKLQKKHGKKLRVSSWQVPPGMRDAKVPAPDDAEDAVAVMVFAALEGKGSHRMDLLGRTRAEVVVEKSALRLDD